MPNEELHRARRKRWLQTDKGKAYQKATAKARRQRRMEWLASYKSTLSCSKCGYDKHPAALQFHHLGGKVDDVARIAKSGRTSMAKLRTEIEKCVVLCANCHAVLHYEERTGSVSTTVN